MNDNNSLNGVGNSNSFDNNKPIFEGFNEPNKVNANVDSNEINNLSINQMFQPVSEINNVNTSADNTVDSNTNVNFEQKYNNVVEDKVANTFNSGVLNSEPSPLNSEEINPSEELTNNVMPTDLETNTVVMPAIEAEQIFNNEIASTNNLEINTNQDAINPGTNNVVNPSEELTNNVMPADLETNTVVMPAIELNQNADVNQNSQVVSPVSNLFDPSLNTLSSNQNNLPAGENLYQQIPIDNSSNNLNEPLKSSNKKKNILILSIIVVLVILVSIFLAIRFYFNNPKIIINKGVDSFANTLVEIVDDYYINTKSDDVYNFYLNSTLDVIDTNNPTIKALDGAGIDISQSIDYQKKELYLAADILENKKSILGAEAYFKGSDVFINSQDVFAKIIKYDLGKIDLETLLSNDVLSEDEIIYIIESMSEHFKKSFNDESKTEEDSTINYFGKNKNVTKITYKIDDEFTKKFKKNIIEDDKLISILKNKLSIGLDDINKFFDNTNGSESSINLYMDKNILNSFVGFSLDSEESLLTTIKGDDINVDLDSTQLKINNSNDVCTIDVLIDDSDLDIKFTFSDDELTYAVKEKNNSGLIKLNFKDDLDNKIEVSYNFLLKTDENGKKNHLSLNGTIGYEMTNTYTNEVNIENSVDFENLTSTDYDKIFSNITKKTEGTFLEDVVNQIITTINYYSNLSNSITGYEDDIYSDYENDYNF